MKYLLVLIAFLFFGAAAGVVIGIPVGVVVVDLLGVSCFEGACGYAAVFGGGGLGLLAGAAAGFALFLWWMRRRTAARANQPGV